MRMFTKCCRVFGSYMIVMLPGMALIPGISAFLTIAKTSFAKAFNLVRFADNTDLPLIFLGVSGV